MIRVPRAVQAIVRAPTRAYGGELPYDPSPLPVEEHHHPHPSKEVLAAYAEYKQFLDSLPNRDYSFVVEELIERCKKGIL